MIAELSSQNTIDTDNFLLEKVEWLKTAVGPWTKVETYWNETFEVRNKERHGAGPVQEVIQKWPLLKHVIGHTLVS